MPKIDPKTFNTDPKHEAERNEFDAMVEAAAQRIAEKNKKANPPKDDEGFIGGLVKGFLGQ